MLCLKKTKKKQNTQTKPTKQTILLWEEEEGTSLKTNEGWKGGLLQDGGIGRFWTHPPPMDRQNLNLYMNHFPLKNIEILHDVILHKQRVKRLYWGRQESRYGLNKKPTPVAATYKREASHQFSASPKWVKGWRPTSSTSTPGIHTTEMNP